MRAKTKIWISITASITVSAVIAYFAFSLMRGMSSDFAQYQRYNEIINEAFVLNILIDDALKQELNRRKIQQIGQVRGTLTKILQSISFSNSREESLIRQLRRNNQELGPLIEQLFDQQEGSGGRVDSERRALLASQLEVKVRFITDDVNRLMETSGNRIISALTKTSLIVLILIGVVIFSNAIIYFISSRSLVRAQEKLRESREDLNRAQVVAHTGSWRMDVQKNELTWSEENHRIFGIPPGTPMTYETFVSIVHPEDREQVDRKWMAALKGEPYDIEHRIIVDGTVKWVRERAELEFNPEGQLLGGFGTTQDITERKEAEDEIKRLASFPQMNPAPVLEVDLSGAITFYNQAALEAVEKLGPEAGLGALISEDLKEIIAAVREKREKCFYREVRIKDKVFGQNIYFAEPLNVLRIYSMDITRRQQAEEALKDSEERFRTMANAIPQLAWIARGDGYIYWYNQRWYDYTGTTPEEMEGWGWQSVHDPAGLPQVLEQWQNSIATGKPFDRVLPLRGGDGQFRPFLTRVMPMKDASGQVMQWFGTNTDITERQQAEETLKMTLADLERSNRELEQFAYISSHDLQEPLRKIANFSDMLVHKYQGRLDEQAERYFGYITDGAKRMQALINDLLNYSRVGRAELPLIQASLEEILKGALHDLNAQIKENHAEISFDPLPTLKVNPPQMGQLLQNLLINAIKFHGDQPPRIHLSARQEGKEWVIAIRDYGIGFDQHYAEDIFKVFKRLHSQEKYPGTGIGLAICQKIVERHGGRIWVESELGRGATFYFAIPS